MRLTLRTLLCYMDEILEPADHADIGQKIEQSEFARDLQVKTRDVTKRLRLSAPAVMGKGMGSDPNSVAEYLDNTMPPERVGEFEKVCLESDMHLAEAAACHQILTLVLGEPAEVDPATRERMYHIKEIAARREQEAANPVPAPKSAEVLAAGTAAAAKSETSETSTATATKKEVHARNKPEVPDYLRESSKSRWKLKAFGLVVAAGIGFIALMFVNPNGMFDKMFNISDELPDHVQAKKDNAPPKIEGLEPTGTSETGEELVGSATGGGTAPAFDPNAGGGTAPPFNPNTGGETSETGGTAPAFDPGPVPSVEAEVPALPAETPPLPDSEVAVAPGPADVLPPKANGAPGAETPPLPSGEVEVPLPGGVPEVKTAPLPGEKNGTNGTLTPMPPVESPVSEPADPTAKPTEVASLPAKEIPVAETPAKPAQQVGVYVSPTSVLLRLEGEMGQWGRLASRSILSSGDRLLALPTFRPTINLTSGMTMHMAGGTSVILETPTEKGVPVIKILYGRLIITGSVGNAGNQIQLQIGDRTHAVTFADADSTIAVHVRRVHVPGADPEAAPAPTVVDLYAASGKITWSTPGTDEPAVEIQAPNHRREGGLFAGEAEIDPTKLPEWIDSEQLGNSDRLASLALEEALTLDRPAGLSLREMVDRRRSEVRSLSARCSVYVGQYEPFVQALKDQDQRASWSLHIETLREAMALSPENAARIREAFERHGGQDGPELYRMLWGYSAADLKAGADKELVDALKSPNLDSRVLAFWNLKNITGIGLNYSPEFPEASRARSVQRWEQLLEDGKIRLPETGEPTPEPEKAIDPTPDLEKSLIPGQD